MTIEIDQSGKLEQLNTATALAFSNDEFGVIWIRAAVKRRIAVRLRKRLLNPSNLWPIVFAAAVYLLIASLPQDVILILDEEYTGKAQVITDVLGGLLQQRNIAGWQGQIWIARIGKHSPAHQLAWETHRNKNRKRVRSIAENELLELIDENRAIRPHLPPSG